MQELPKLTGREIVQLRPKWKRPDPTDHYWDLVLESEPRSKQGSSIEVATIFLVGSECSFRCTMCDLWKYTHLAPTPRGNIVRQIEGALREIDLAVAAGAKRPKWVKLYNASNFFSPRNIPVADLPSIARLLQNFDRVIVENHPKLVGEGILDFQALLQGQLEIAMGLETVHPSTLEQLNKSMDLDDFSQACRWLRDHAIDCRSFVLLRPPGMSGEEGETWARKSIDYACQQGVRHVSVIPVRGGNGTLEHLRRLDLWQPPSADAIERIMRQVEQFPAIVTADLWDWPHVAGHCSHCSAARKSALEQANLSQKPPPSSQAECACLFG